MERFPIHTFPHLETRFSGSVGHISPKRTTEVRPGTRCCVGWGTCFPFLAQNRPALYFKGYEAHHWPNNNPLLLGEVGPWDFLRTWAMIFSDLGVSVTSKRRRICLKPIWKIPIIWEMFFFLIWTAHLPDRWNSERRPILCAWISCCHVCTFHAKDVVWYSPDAPCMEYLPTFGWFFWQM